MAVMLLSLLLSLQLSVSSALPFREAEPAPAPHRLWWGMIDPELSAWFARLPGDAEEAPHPVLWNWSWRGFLAALTGQHTLLEADDASQL